MLECNFTPYPALETERTLLRQVTEADAPAIFLLRSDPEVLKYINKTPCGSLAEAVAFVKMITDNLQHNTGVTWGIVMKDAPEQLIGTMAFWRLEKENFRAEVGYVLLPAWHRKGIMAEVLGAAVRYGFETMKLHTIAANINPENTASQKLLERQGFVLEGNFRENIFFDGRFYDTAAYRLRRPH